MREIWLPTHVRGDRYEVSNLGRVRSSWAGGRILKVQPLKDDGHLVVTMYLDRRQKKVYVHQLVARAFVAGDGPVVRHLDDNPTNNLPENLRWGTQRDNLLDAIANGKHPASNKTHCIHGHSLADAYRSGTHRTCRECQADRTARYKARKAAA